jgi:hypothetical protein
MQRSLMAAVLAAAAIAGGGLVDSARAEPAGAMRLQPLAPFTTGSTDNLRMDVQYYPYLYHRHRYCWYDDAWRGPGWYWCGYGYRNGFGWGGGLGWLGWGHEGFRGGVYRGGGYGGRNGGHGYGGHDGGHHR